MLNRVNPIQVVEIKNAGLAGQTWPQTQRSIPHTLWRRISLER